MARQRSGFNRGSGANRRRTGWEVGPGGTGPTTVTANAVDVLGSGSEALQDGLTLVRTRGFIEMLLTAAGSASVTGFSGAIGIGIVTAPAFAIGITAMPAPLDEVDWEGWLWHQFFFLHVGDPTAGDRDTNRLNFEVDSKAMRKIGTDEVIFAALQSVEQVAGETMKVFFDSRLLFKLS